METILIGLVAIVIYLIPYSVALGSKHKSRSAILVLNLALGWTVLGWLAALIWANTGNVEKKESGPSPDTHVKCPDCAELVKREAKICKHCGCKLIPQ